MGKYIYDNETGKRYEIHDDNDKKSSGGEVFLFLIILVLVVAFAPGILITSIFSNLIENTSWAWFWCISFSSAIFFVVWYVYSKVLNYSNYWKWTIVSYILLSGISILILKTSNSDQIKYLFKLLLGN
jgi:magnesium-transporting ATPase (P-type)